MINSQALLTGERDAGKILPVGETETGLGNAPGATKSGRSASREMEQRDMTRRTTARSGSARKQPGVVRSDASTLHVDFENVTDGLISARNAGVLIHYQTRARILDNFAFAGRRCAHVAVHEANVAARLVLVRAWDAPQARDNAVVEFVYRPALDKPVALKRWRVLACFTRGGSPGAYELKYLNDPVFGADASLAGAAGNRQRPVAVTLYANGRARDGTYNIDVVAHGGTKKNALRNLPQAAWTRFILHRHDGVVDVFAGPPDRETFAGTYEDLLPGGEIYSLPLGNPEETDARGAGYWDAVRVGRPLRTGRTPAPPEERVPHVGALLPAPPRPLLLGPEKHLLIDDWSLAETHNIRRTFHRPAKYSGNPLIVCDKPWEATAVYLSSGAVRDPSGRYRLWYNAADPASPTGAGRKNVHTCLAVSKDGIHWTKPDLGIHEYAGSSANNIVIRDAGMSRVFVNPDDPRPDFRYLAKMRHQGTHAWTSPDGLHWTDRGAILADQALDASSCHWDPIRKKYVASVKIGYKERRYRGYAESEDFLHWTDTYPMMDVDELDVRGDQVYSMMIYRYESLYLGMCKIYHVGSSDTCDIQLAVSHDCRRWERPFRSLISPSFATRDKPAIHYPDPDTQPFIPTGAAGAWDFGNNNSPATAPVRVGDTLYFYYGGRPCTHGGKGPDGKTWRGPGAAIGLATLRVDGFVSADADDSGGTVLTRPLKLDGANLYVNTDAEGGRLAVEVLDARLRPIEPFTIANARAIRADAARRKCAWRGVSDLSAVAGRTIRLRFHLAGASLYAFWCK